MTSVLAKYSENAVMSSSTQNRIKQFCPLIIYHDNPSEQLEMKLNANKYHDRTAIDRHRDKTNEMLEHNAQFWSEKSNDSFAGLVEFEADYLDKDIKVSPSTSTTSNISSSSSSSGDSIATIEHPSYQSHRTIKATNNSNYYTSIEEEKYYPMISRKQSKSKSTPCNISTSPISPTAPISTITTPITPTSTTTSSSATAKNDSTVKRRRGNLPKEVTEFLRKWLIQHKKHPYPAEKEKADLARHTGLTVNQISNWFINARRRILQPMLESENLTAQMMNYPELVNHQQQSSASAFIEPPRRRRHDFYTYQRDFVSPTIEHQHQHHQSMHHLHLHEQQEYQHPHQHYYSDQQHQQEEHSSRFRRTRLIDTNDHYHQLSMR